MHKKITDFGNSLVAKTGLTLTTDDVEENLTGSIESLVSFIPDSLKLLLLPVAVLTVLFLAGAVYLGYFKGLYLGAVLFFLCSLLIAVPGGLILGLKSLVRRMTRDTQRVIQYSLDLTKALYRKAELNQAPKSSLQDTFGLVMCFMVIPAVEKVLENLLGIVKIVLYGLIEHILFVLTKLIYAKLAPKKSPDSGPREDPGRTSEKLDELQRSITRTVKAGTWGTGFILNFLLLLDLLLGIPPLIIIVWLSR